MQIQETRCSELTELNPNRVASNNQNCHKDFESMSTVTIGLGVNPLICPAAGPV